MANVRKEDLTVEELVSLKEVGKGVSQTKIPDEHKRRLLELRLIKEGVGGLTLTRHGTFIARSEPPSLAGMPREKRSW